MSHVTQLFLRGFFVVLLVVFPTMMVPGISQDVAQGVTLLALIAAVVVVVEYSAAYPGLIEFRDAKPYNRLRFLILSMIVIFVTLLQREVGAGPEGSQILLPIGLWLAQVLDFPFSPVRMFVSALPGNVEIAHLINVLAAASLAYVICLFGLIGFGVVLFMGYWPRNNASFNVWVNLPNFDPTKGVDVVQRLERDAQINVLLGIILPFSLPVILHVSSLLVQPMTLETPLALVWGVSLWAFVPISLIMRGVAMHRVAQLIRAQRRRISEEENAIPLPARSVYS